MLKHFGFRASNADLKRLAKLYDTDGDGKISYKEFCARLGSKLHPSSKDGGLFSKQQKVQRKVMHRGRVVKTSKSHSRNVYDAEKNLQRQMFGDFGKLQKT